MLNFEELRGFVIDLSTKEKTLEELKYVLHSEEDRKDIIDNYSVEYIREFIMEYYIHTYYDAYIFVKSLNVYQICENELEVFE